MGHLLSTVNPAAAAAIENPAPAPDVGTWVVYKGRAGFSRMMRTEFPALVLGEHREGGLILMVVMEPEDMMMEDRVPFRSHDQEYFYWRYRRQSEAEIEGGNHRLNAFAQRLTKLEDHLAGDDMVVEDVEKLDARLKMVEGILASDEIEVMQKQIADLAAKIESAVGVSPANKRTDTPRRRGGE